MAGTRGIARFRGEQLNDKILRDRHFDANHPIKEDKVDIRWREHREILEDTKIDVWVQVNDVPVAGQSSIDITSVVGELGVAINEETEGVVLDKRVELRKTGTDDFPKISPTGERVYGRVRQGEEGTEDEGKFFLDFYVTVDGIEQPFEFDENAGNIDYRYIVRTNLSVIPVDALVNGGSGFVEGATDAKAYMNLEQLRKDIYGNTGTYKGDGHAILDMPIVEQIEKEREEREEADQQIRDDLASTLYGEGASLVGVITDPNYQGATVQEVLSNLAARLVQQEQSVEVLENEDEREVYEAVGGETEYMLQKGTARPNTLFVSINGALQAPGINYDEIFDEEGNIIGISFEPDTLQVKEGIPDVLMVWYKKVL